MLLSKRRLCLSVPGHPWAPPPPDPLGDLAWMGFKGHRVRKTTDSWKSREEEEPEEEEDLIVFNDTRAPGRLLK